MTSRDTGARVLDAARAAPYDTEIYCNCVLADMLHHPGIYRSRYRVFEREIGCKLSHVRRQRRRHPGNTCRQTVCVPEKTMHVQARTHAHTRHGDIIDRRRDLRTLAPHKYRP